MLTARPEHPFVAEGPISLTRLADATLVFYDRGSDDYEATQSLLREGGVTPYGVIEVDSVDTARRLTERGLGVAFLPSTSAVPEVEAGRSAVSQVEQGDDGELTIAAASAVNASVVPELVARFRRYHPGVHLYVHTGSAERITELVAFGTAQLGLVREVAPSRDPRVRVTPLYEEASLLVARPEHPFVAEGEIPLARLADATLVFYDRGSDDYTAAQSLLKEGGVTPYGVIEVDSVDTARRLVERGLGVAFLPATAAVPSIEAERLSAVSLADARPTSWRIVALERTEASTWPPVATLRKLLGDVASFVPGAESVEPAAP